MRAWTISLCAAAAWALAGCSTTERSLIFFTNTTTGLEVSAGASSTDPVRIIVGYKRQEGVLNPVYDANGTETVSRSADGSYSAQVAKYRDNAYSVLAKYAGGASGGASGAQAAATNSQWFATGKAADILAAQPGIAGAVTGSGDVANAAAEQAKALQLSDATRQAALNLVGEVYTGFESLKATDPTAAAFLTRLDDLDNDLYRPSFFEYNVNSGQKTVVRTEYDRAKSEGSLASGFQRVIKRWSRLRASVGHLANAPVDAPDAFKWNGKAADTDEGKQVIAATSADRGTLPSQLAKFEDSLSREPVLLEAVDYFVRRLTQK